MHPMAWAFAGPLRCREPKLRVEVDMSKLLPHLEHSRILEAEGSCCGRELWSYQKHEDRRERVDAGNLLSHLDRTRIYCHSDRVEGILGGARFPPSAVGCV